VPPPDRHVTVDKRPSVTGATSVSDVAKDSGALAVAGLAPMIPAETPRKSLGGLDAEAAAALVAAAADVALVVDADGVIRDVAFGSEEMSREGYAKWLGQPWAETVTAESRPKVEALLRDVASNVATKGRHVNHTSARGADIPVLYSAVQLGGTKRVVAIGRDLRGVAALQQRLVEAQQSMERDYWRLRQAETRYRLLFQSGSEAVLIVDASSEKIVESNPAAGQLFGEAARHIVGQSIHEIFDKESAQAVLALLAKVRSAGRAEDVSLRIVERKREFLVTATIYRQEKASFFLFRFAPSEVNAAAVATEQTKINLAELVENAPDGFVVTDLDGKVLSANSSFVELAQIVSHEQARGQSLERWLGRPGVDLDVLIANLRQHGSVRLFSTTLRGDYGATAEVEISAVSIPSGDGPCLGFTIRNVGRRLSAYVPPSQEFPHSVQQLTELVGRVPLKDIVRDTTDLIERLCILAALDLTRDNRASAAEMLGISRQSLYVKLHRYGLGDLAVDIDH
jgi:transcriptional regulator PpsR